MTTMRALAVAALAWLLNLQACVTEGGVAWMSGSVSVQFVVITSLIKAYARNRFPSSVHSSGSPSIPVRCDGWPDVALQEVG